MLNKRRRVTHQEGEGSTRNQIGILFTGGGFFQRHLIDTDFTKGAIAMNIGSLLFEADPALEVRIPDPNPLDALMISGSSSIESATRVSSTHQSATRRVVSMP